MVRFLLIHYMPRSRDMNVCQMLLTVFCLFMLLPVLITALLVTITFFIMAFS